MLVCQHCNKECVNSNSLRNHERCCPSNPNRNYKNGMTGKKGANHFTYGAKMSDETKERIRQSAKGKKLSVSTKEKLSKVRSDFMKANPEKCRRKISWMEETFAKWLFDRQIPYKSEVHFRNMDLDKSYFVDFLFDELKLIVELDGNQHEKRKEHDEERDKYLKSLGYEVIRITHHEYQQKSKVGILEEYFASLVQR